MRCAFIFVCRIVLAAFLALPLAAAAQSHPQTQIVDGIVARIEDDIITLSELRELAAYQQLLDGHSQANQELRSELIEQWIVNNEAAGARFPVPAEAEVNREIARIENNFPSSAAYQERLDALTLTADAVRRIVTQQIYLARYLDYKFRSSVEVSDSAIANYYQDHLIPELRAKGQPAPPLTDVTPQIRELLIEQGVNERAAAWLDETKPRLKIQLQPMQEFSLSSSGKP